MYNLMMISPWAPLVGVAWVIACALVVGSGFEQGSAPRNPIDPLGAIVGAAFGLITLAAVVLAVGVGRWIFNGMVGGGA